MVTRVLFLVCLAVQLSACSYGWLYTDTVTPYCTNMKNTPVDSLSHSAGLKQISIPRIPGAAAQWDSNTIHDAALSAGITQVAFCDRRRFRLPLGIWEEDVLVVYGR